MLLPGERIEFLEQHAHAPETISGAELVQLCAVDGLLFAKTFFPKTCRMGFADFHPEMWEIFDDPHARYINLQVFRGGAKTSMLRILSAKRIAYGLSRTALYIGKSEGHATRSVRWVRNAVQFNTFFANTFQLRKGEKWQEHEAEIYHGTDEFPIWLLGVGITGSVRGVNFDDYRPDFILIDDVLDNENSATPDQREKLGTLIHGAVKESLAPATEVPDAKMAMLQTPLDKEDASTLALSDPEFVSRVFGCWTPETADGPVSLRRSSWEERYPTPTLQAERHAAIGRNKLSVFTREKECRITAPETSAFMANWLKFYDELPPREDLVVTGAVDPVPPPSEVQIAKGLRGKDYEALALTGRLKGTSKVFLLEYSFNRGHDPDWTVAEFFRLSLKWRPRLWRVETVAYQKTLEWILRREMQKRRKHFLIQEQRDRRSKYDRIVDGLNGVASNGDFYVSNSHDEFVSQFIDYPDIAHDDVLEAVAVSVADLEGLPDGEDADTVEDESDIPELEYYGGAP